MIQSAIAVDLGGTNMRAALVTEDGDIHHHLNRPTLADQGPDVVIQRLTSLIEEVVELAEPDPEVGVGVIAPGPLNPKTGVVHYGPNLPGWYDVPLKATLEERLGRTVIVGNDANCAALGEWIFGAGQDTQHLIYIGLGTGVGGGVISHGILIDGVSGMGGELGHVSIDSSGPRCTCGGIGCIEAYIGGWAIAREGELLVRSERSDKIAAIAGDGPITAEVVARAAQEGDREARAVLRQAAQKLSVALGGFVNIFNPEVIVIGGGLAHAGELILEPFKEMLPRYVMVPIYPDVEIRGSSLGDDTGIYGAAASVFYAMETSKRV